MFCIRVLLAIKLYGIPRGKIAMFIPESQTNVQSNVKWVTHIDRQRGWLYHYHWQQQHYSRGKIIQASWLLHCLSNRTHRKHWSLQISLNLYQHTHIIIWFDNLSSFQAISTLSTRSRTSGDCYDTLNALGSTNTLEIWWIAAHIGLWGNDKVDELAKIVTTTESTLRCPIPQFFWSTTKSPD